MADASKRKLTDDIQRQYMRELLKNIPEAARRQIAKALNSGLWPPEVDVTDLISAINEIASSGDYSEKEIQRVLEREKKRALRARTRLVPYAEWDSEDGSESDVSSETGWTSEAPERAYIGGEHEPLPDLEKLNGSC